MDLVKKIVIIGPESTGKSTLTKALAHYYQTTFADEFARTYLEQLTRDYNETDLSLIAQGQIKAEETAIKLTDKNLVFFDTDLQVIKVWSEHKFNICDAFVLEQIAIRNYDYYLLTGIDMPWTYDPLREHPSQEMRNHFFHIYKDIVVQSNLPFTIINGNETERLAKAINTVDDFMNNN